jgi:hypothetical protein
MAGQAPFRILSIDGGGIRGLIPARLVQELETRLQRPIQQAFDLIAGTSTGGLLALGFNHRGADGQPLSGKAGVKLYLDNAQRIFGDPRWSLEQLRYPKYDAKGLEAALADTFGDALLSDALGEVLVPTYALDPPPPPPDHGRHLPNPFFFKTWKTRSPRRRTQTPEQKDRDFRMRDAARATSAAPTYFEPAQIASVSAKSYFCCDGGVFANNPAMCAIASARELLHARGEAATRPIYMVSLGTGKQEKLIPPDETWWGWGKVGWIPDVLEVMFDGMADTVDYQVQRELAHQSGTAPDGGFYHRFQPYLTPDADGYPATAFDDVEEKNLKALIDTAERLIGDQAAAISTVVTDLADWPPPEPPDRGDGDDGGDGGDADDGNGGAPVA